MTDDPRSPPDGRRKRPPTVLDLEATDVTPAAEPGTEGAPPAEAAADPSAGPSPSENFVPPPPPEPPHPRTSAGWFPEGMAWTHVGAGVAGATGGLLVFLLLWFGGALPSVREPAADLAPQLATIQKQLKDLSDRPAPPSVDPKALDAVAARLAKLEAAPAPPAAPVADPAIADRLGGIESAMKSLTENVAALSRRADGLDGAMREANTRIDKLSATLAAAQSAMREAAAGSDRASRLALAATALRDAVERGTPFAAELAIVKPLSTDASDVAVLEPFAGSGLPDNAALGRELAALIEPMLKPSAAEPSPSGGGSGFLDRLQAHAEKLVRVRPVDEARGDDRGAILFRIQQRAMQGDVAAVLTELGRLPPEARAPFQHWIDKAAARSRAVDASRRLAANAIAALKPSP